MIYTEREAKVVSAVWGTEFIKFLAVLVILLLDDLFLHIILVQFILFFISSWFSSAFFSYHTGAKQLRQQGN